MGVVAHPIKVFLASASVDDQQILVIAEAVHNHVINKRPLRIKQCGILGLSNGEAGSVIHRDVLDGSQRFRTLQANIAHVTYVENANARANRIVLGDDSAGRRIFNRHVPAVEFDHLRSHLAMDGVERGFANGRSCCFNSRQMFLDQSSGWAARSDKTHYPNMAMARASTERAGSGL